MRKPKRIILVGHMGAGRSLLGNALANKLGWQFIDIYLGLERYMGRSLGDVVGKLRAQRGRKQSSTEFLQSSNWIASCHLPRVARSRNDGSEYLRSQYFKKSPRRERVGG